MMQLSLDVFNGGLLTARRNHGQPALGKGRAGWKHDNMPTPIAHGSCFGTNRRPSCGMLVIFDCDGVLVDSEIISNTILADMLGALGWKITLRDAVDTFVGRTIGACMEIIREHVGADRVPANFEDMYRERTRVAFEFGLRPVPGIVDALDAVEAAGFKTCVASSGSHEKIRSSLKRTGLLDRFEGRIFGASDATRGKPAPDLFLHAAASMGFSTRDCIVVEDTPIGIAAGRAAGMKVFAYTGTFQSDKLQAPDVQVFGSMEELAFLIDMQISI